MKPLFGFLDRLIVASELARLFRVMTSPLYQMAGIVELIRSVQVPVQPGEYNSPSVLFAIATEDRRPARLRIHLAPHTAVGAMRTKLAKSLLELQRESPLQLIADGFFSSFLRAEDRWWKTGGSFLQTARRASDESS